MKVLGQTSRASSSHKNNENVYIDLCPEICGFFILIAILLSTVNTLNM
jgi:hypothetical protein